MVLCVVIGQRKEDIIYTRSDAVISLKQYLNIYSCDLLMGAKEPLETTPDGFTVCGFTIRERKTDKLHGEGFALTLEDVADFVINRYIPEALMTGIEPGLDTVEGLRKLKAKKKDDPLEKFIADVNKGCAELELAIRKMDGREKLKHLSYSKIKSMVEAKPFRYDFR